MLNILSFPVLNHALWTIIKSKDAWSNRSNAHNLSFILLCFFLIRIVRRNSTWICTVNPGCVTQASSCRFTIHARGAVTLLSALTTIVIRRTGLWAVLTKGAWFTLYNQMFCTVLPSLIRFKTDRISLKL